MRLAALIAAAAALAAPAAAGERETAYDVAVAIARDGPRPAAGAAERRAHIALRSRLAAAGLEVEVQRFGVRGRGRSRNVIAALDTPRDCLRIVMAHTDSTPNAPGANDNASGLGVLAELAPRLRSLEPGCDVWLVATGAEERIYTGSPDHLGSLALARLVKRRGLAGRLRYALSLDEVGRDRPFWLRSPVRAARRGVEREILTAARAEEVAVSWVRDEGSGNSDHREFELLGMRGAKLGVGADGEPCRHSPCDRPGRLRASSLRAARLVVERALRAR
ncbi:MAG TPA: M28 family peptidase [Thermoleophilaceae bacterium]